MTTPRGRFRPIPLAQLADAFNEVPHHALWDELIPRALRLLPGGSTALWGIPFSLASETAQHRWLWLGPGARDSATIQIGAKASYIVLAHFTTPTTDTAERSSPDPQPSGFVTTPGERVAEYVLDFADGRSHSQQIRRRFEVHDLITQWGQMAFLARPHRAERPLEWRGPHSDGEWGQNQTAALLPAYGGIDNSRQPAVPVASYWIYALKNPHPDTSVAAIRLLSKGTGSVAVGGLTLFGGDGHPLRHGELVPLLLTPADPEGPSLPVSVDLGTIARRYPVSPVDVGPWLSGDAGFGSPPANATGSEIIEVTAAQGAFLTVGDNSIALAGVLAGDRPRSAIGARITPLPRADVTIRVSVVDASTGSGVPARVHFEAADGRYLPPHGHRKEVNDRWFEDYGADLKLGGTSYAYVDGSFSIDLPVGDVLVEVVKGFEFAPLRRQVRIEPGQTELEFSLDRPVDLRREGWVSADTHVHFISPDTARLEAEAEGVNVVNVLAAQWGDLFTNIGDFTGALSGASGPNTIVWVGTENRQHLLGHLSMLGIRGRPSDRLSAGGPSESFLGDPVWNPLAQWADECRERGGLVVIPHFPDPHCEVVADVILNKVDAVEIRDFWWGIDSRAVREWYRLLNCGFRVTAVGGTDKMSAAMPVGGVRTYARIDDAGLSFESWADAVRAGRTITTSGPFLTMTVDGHKIGAQIDVGVGRSHVEVEASARGIYELSALEIVHNGTVVARRDADAGRREIRLSERIKVNGGWLAARVWGPGRAWHVWPVQVAAHTSPVYLSGAGFAPRLDDISYLRALLEGGKAWLGTLATGSPAQIERAETVFNDAMRELSRLPPTQGSEERSARTQRSTPGGTPL